MRSFGTREHYITNATAPYSEVQLAQKYLTFAPVAAGGYFWFVMMSRGSVPDAKGSSDQSQELLIVEPGAAPKARSVRCSRSACARLLDKAFSDGPVAVNADPLSH